MLTILRSSLISAVLMAALVMEEGLDSGYDAVIYGVYCADCVLLGHVLGWAMLRIPAGRRCLDLAFSRLVPREARAADSPAART
jgi:hypothetical protein